MDRRIWIGALVGVLAGALGGTVLGGGSDATAQARPERHFRECYALQVRNVVGDGVGLGGPTAPVIATPIPSGWSVLGTVSPGAPGIVVCR